MHSGWDGQLAVYGGWSGTEALFVSLARRMAEIAEISGNGWFGDE
jgi:hypothetical protein